MYTATKAVVLAIDDDQAVRESLSNYLEDFGYTVVQGDDGQVGLELFRAHRPDIVLVDLRMPQLDGLQVLEQIRQESPLTPTIVVSGAADIQDAVAALRKGAWDYLLKPIQDMAILTQAIETCLQEARVRHQNQECPTCSKN